MGKHGSLKVPYTGGDIDRVKRAFGEAIRTRDYVGAARIAVIAGIVKARVNRIVCAMRRGSLIYEYSRKVKHNGK